MYDCEEQAAMSTLRSLKSLQFSGRFQERLEVIRREGATTTK
jgi:hypothetical protein